MEESGLQIIVYDSGVGMSADQIKNVLEASEKDDIKGLSGFGLRGTINRIRYYYDYDNIVQIRSEPGEYTEIEIYIPKMRKTKTEGKFDSSFQTTY